MPRLTVGREPWIVGRAGLVGRGWWIVLSSAQNSWLMTLNSHSCEQWEIAFLHTSHITAASTARFTTSRSTIHEKARPTTHDPRSIAPRLMRERE